MSTDETSPQGNTEGNDAQAQLTRDDAGLDELASEYQYATHSKGRGSGIDDETVNDVFAAVREAHANGRTYVSAANLDVEDTRTAVGKALRALADDDGCPLDLERWTGMHTTPTVWHVKKPEPQPVPDGGHDHDVPVEEHLPDAQLELVDDTGGDA